MIRWLILFLLIPSLCFAQSSGENTIGGYIASPHLIQVATAETLAPAPYLDFVNATGDTINGTTYIYTGSGGGGSAGLTVGTTTIANGTNGYVEYNNNGVLGEEVVSSSQWTLSGSNLYPNSTTYTTTVGVATTSYDVSTVNANGTNGNGMAVNYIPNSVNGTGGSITIVGGKQINTFTSSGTFTPTNSGTVEVLVVAGGGGGGWGGSGGGGAGGVVHATSYSVTGGSPITVTVGTGGASGNSGGSQGASGNNSVFGTITALGGGGGNSNGNNGISGGSAGGGSYTGIGGTATQGNSGGGTGYGNNGGNGGSVQIGGGGGGAGAVGSNAVGSTPGNGGAGMSFSTSGSSVCYAGGGGGGGGNATATCGGGNGAVGGSGQSGSAATANTGGGGGSGNSGGGAGAAGGSGIVIVSYTAVGAVPEYLLANNGTTTAKFWTDGNNSSRLTFTVAGTNALYLSTAGIVTFPNNPIGPNAGNINYSTFACGANGTSGTAVISGTTNSVTWPTAGKIISSTTTGALSAGNCSCTIDIWKTNAAIPTVSNTITASDLPALSTATYSHDTTLSGWTTSIAANDVLMCNIQSGCTCDNVNVVLGVAS